MNTRDLYLSRRLHTIHSHIRIYIQSIFKFTELKDLATVLIGARYKLWCNWFTLKSCSMIYDRFPTCWERDDMNGNNIFTDNGSAKPIRREEGNCQSLALRFWHSLKFTTNFLNSNKNRWASQSISYKIKIHRPSAVDKLLSECHPTVNRSVPQAHKTKLQCK